MDRRERDMDLILELAGGDLPPAEAAEAEQSLDTEARGELAAQRTAREALARLARPTMSEAERRRLRAAVAAELRLEAGSGREPAPPPRRRWWRRPGSLGALTAVASLVAVVAISLSLAGNFPFAGSDDEAAFTAAPTTAAATTVVALAEAAPTTAAAAEQAIAEATTTAAITAAPAPTTTDEKALALAEEPLEVAEMATDEAAALAEPDTVAEHDRDPAAPEAPPAFDVATDRPDEMARSLDAIAEERGDPFPLSQLVELATGEGLECPQTLVDETEPDAVVLVMARGLVDGAEAELYVVQSSDPDHDPIVAVFILPDCLPVAIDQ